MSSLPVHSCILNLKSNVSNNFRQFVCIRCVSHEISRIKVIRFFSFNNQRTQIKDLRLHILWKEYFAAIKSFANLFQLSHFRYHFNLNIRYQTFNTWLNVDNYLKVIKATNGYYQILREQKKNTTKKNLKRMAWAYLFNYTHSMCIIIVHDDSVFKLWFVGNVRWFFFLPSKCHRPTITINPSIWTDKDIQQKLLSPLRIRLIFPKIIIQKRSLSGGPRPSIHMSISDILTLVSKWYEKQSLSSSLPYSKWTDICNSKNMDFV